MSNKGYYRKNKIVIRAKQREYYIRNKESILEKQNAYHLRNRKSILGKMKQRYLKERGYRLQRQRKYYNEHREEYRAYWKTYRIENAGRLRGRALAYRRANIDRIREYDRKRSAVRIRTPEHKRYIRRWHDRNRFRLRDKRARLITALKISFGNKCLSCGYKKHPETFQFDHLGQTRLGRKRGYKDRNLWAMKEPARFQLLCPNCHAIKTATCLRMKNPSKAALKYRRCRSKLIVRFGGRCVFCRYNKSELALHFDHIKPTYRGMNRYGATTEVVKNPDLFQLVCANCHALKTMRDMAVKTAQRDADKAPQKTSKSTTELLSDGRIMRTA